MMDESKIPGWMLQNDSPDVLAAVKAPSLGFIKKTINEISRIVQDDLLSERYAAKKGLLQGIDPKVKLLTILLFTVFAGGVKSFITLILLAALGAAMAKLSSLSLSAFFKRVWLVLPGILLLISIPAATNLIIPGRPLLHLWGKLYFTMEGIQVVLKSVLRVGVSFSFGYLLVMTTRWTHITKSLIVLRVPSMLVTILDMTYRYIFVLARILSDMFEARFLRVVGSVRNAESRKFVSNSMALLLVRAKQMGEDIYDAMLCRGYIGDPVSLKQFRFTKFDLLWVINVGVISVILLMGEIIFG